MQWVVPSQSTVAQSLLTVDIVALVLAAVVVALAGTK